MSGRDSSSEADESTSLRERCVERAVKAARKSAPAPESTSDLRKTAPASVPPKPLFDCFDQA